jgi:hypothetical protein
MEIKADIVGDLSKIYSLPAVLPFHVETAVKLAIKAKIEPRLRAGVEEALRQVAANQFLTRQFKREIAPLDFVGFTFDKKMFKGYFFPPKLVGSGERNSVHYLYGSHNSRGAPRRASSVSTTFTKANQLIVYLHGGKNLAAPRPIVYSPTAKQRGLFKRVYYFYLKRTRRLYKKPHQLRKKSEAKRVSQKRADANNAESSRVRQLLAHLRTTGGHLSNPPLTRRVLIQPRPFFLIAFARLKGMMIEELKQAVSLALTASTSDRNMISPFSFEDPSLLHVPRAASGVGLRFL